jgi:hypothetical protein
MTLNWRFSGIYDVRTLKHLRENKVGQFIFDLRPKSFNFIQEYRLTEILENLPMGTVYLLFNNEKDFVIERIVNECRKVFSGPLYLEFDGAFNQSIVEASGLPFYQHIIDSKLDSSGLYHGQCAGHVFDYKHLHEVFNNHKLTGFIKDYYSKFSNQSLALKQDLSLDWDSDIFPSLFDYFDFDSLTLPINSKVELCYRNVDLNRVSNQLKLLSQNL